jgi:hypothetical protein
LRKLLIAISAVIVCQLFVAARESHSAKRLSNADRAIVLAAELEVRANRLEKRRDVCIGFGNGLAVDQEGIISELNSRGMKLHPNEWCNEGPRGFVDSILAPVDEPRPGIYELVVQLGDLGAIRRQADHFGTLLRRGSYTVQSDDSGEPEIIAYRKTCCPEQAIP